MHSMEIQTFFLLTFQKSVQLPGPVKIITLIAGLIPDQCTFDVAFRRHRPKTETRVAADQRVVQLPLGRVRIQSLVEHSQHRAEEAGQDGIENYVEQQDLS